MSDNMGSDIKTSNNFNKTHEKSAEDMKNEERIANIILYLENYSSTINEKEFFHSLNKIVP